MKISLISLTADIHSFGIRTLSSVLKKEGHQVSLIFMANEIGNIYSKDVLEELSELVCDSSFIGISVMTNFFIPAVQISEKIKNKMNIPLLWGGIHPTIASMESLKYADVVFLGEAEQTLLELINKRQAEENIYHVSGTYSKLDGNIIKNAIPLLNRDLNSIPYPDYSNENHYILFNQHLISATDELLKYYWSNPGGAIFSYPTVASRGCALRCSYCCNNVLNNMFPGHNVIRNRSVDNLIGELRLAIQKPFIKSIRLWDDSFISNSIEYIEKFCFEYKKNINLPLFSNATPHSITKEKLDMLVSVGLSSIEIGIQSGSERTSHLYNRHFKNELFIPMSNLLGEYKNKIKYIQYDIILDNPLETEDDLIETLFFLLKLKTPYCLELFSLVFYPGTEIYNIAQKCNIIFDNNIQIYNKNYYSTKNIYINKLFHLLHKFALSNKTISRRLLAALVDKNIRKYRISYLICIVLNLYIAPFYYIKRCSRYYDGTKMELYLIIEDIKAGKYKRMYIYIKKTINRVLSFIYMQ